MVIRNTTIIEHSQDGLIATHRVLKNTYFLLSLTLLWSALTAFFAMTIHAPPVGIIGFLFGMFGLSMLTTALRNSPWGLLAIFAFTGFMGYMLGPLLNMYLHAFSNGAALVGTALGGTGIIFLSLSGYVLTTKQDFSYMGGFLFAAILVAFMAGLGAILFNMPLLNLVVSGAFMLLSSGMILFHTSNIIHGGERNYIMATISLYIALFNVFVNLLQILAAFAGNRE